MAGELVHYELVVKDADAAQKFWSGLFGWEFGPSFSPEMDYRIARINEASGAAISAADEGKHHPNVYLLTDDIDASLAKTRELGGEAGDKSPVPGMGWFAACKDDQGVHFSLWQSDTAAA